MASNDNSFDAEFNFTWKIKNFSYCFPWTMVRSPTFTIESMEKTSWGLHLWPKEYTNGVHMEYYLAREEVDSGPEFIRVAFELSFLDSCGIQLVKRRREASFPKDKFKGFSEFVEQAVVFTHRKSKYLPEDTLTACCRMRQIGCPTQEPVFSSGTTVIGVERISFDWNIENFSKIRQGMKRTIRKKTPFIKADFSISAKPEEAIQFEISHAHMNKPNMTDCAISVVNASKVIFSKRDTRYLEGKVWEFPKFLKKRQLVAEKNVCLKRDVLALRFTISISLGVIRSAMDGYKGSFSLEDKVSSGNFQSNTNEDESIIEDFSSAANEHSLVKMHLDRKTEVGKPLDEKRKNSKEISEGFSTEDSPSLINEGVLPAQKKECSLIADKTVGELKDTLSHLKPSFEDKDLSSNEKGDFPLTTNENILKYKQPVGIIETGVKETEENEKTRRKEIYRFSFVDSQENENEEFSSEDSSSFGSFSINGSFSQTQSEESSSTADEAAGKFDDKDFIIEEILSTSSMKGELQSFYQAGTFSDINLTVGKDTFPAHKLILSLRSRKFKEILMNDLSKDSIELTDLDPETLRDLLGFIYTNAVDNLTWKKAQKLHFAADSYQVTPLKHACFMFMTENINASNACNALILADEQQDTDVKQLALDYIVKNGKSIVSTKEWDELSKNHIKLAFETMQQMYLKQT